MRNLLIILTLPVLWIAAGCSAITENPPPVILDPGPEACMDRVLVVVWGDLNQDGVQDHDEPPLADVLLRVAPKDNPADEGIQLATSQDGRANFPTRELKDCSTLGYQLLFLRQVPGYEFPAQPLADLDGFDPNTDSVLFGLLPEGDQ